MLSSAGIAEHDLARGTVRVDPSVCLSVCPSHAAVCQQSTLMMIGSRGFHRRVVQGLYSGFFDSNFDTLGALQNSGVTTSEQNVLGSLNFVSQFDVASVDSRVV